MGEQTLSSYVYNNNKNESNIYPKTMEQTMKGMKKNMTCR